MFDIGLPEMAIIVIIAVVVIGPSELPRALSTAGKWMGKARGVMANFRTGLDAMVRESELHEMEKKWASENERIMIEHPHIDADSEAVADADSVEDAAHQMQPLDGPPAGNATDEPELPMSDQSKPDSSKG